MSVLSVKKKSNTSRWVLLSVGALVAVVALIGIWARLASRTDAVRVGGVYVLVDGFHLKQSASDVGYSGQLVVLADRCLVLQDPAGHTYLAVWPRGSRLAATRNGVEIHTGGHKFRPGDRITYGVVRQRSAADLPVPSACRGHSARLIFEPSRY
jgi:hypothetical protein